MHRILLDTNAYSAYRKGDVSILEQLARADEVLICMFVYAELLYGFKGGNRESENRRSMDAFLRKPTVRYIQPSLETSEIFVDIKTQLKQKGKPIPTHDLWIAASNIESGSVLITYDQHFSHIDGLRVWGDF